MKSLPVVSDPRTTQAEFQIGYVWVALATAVLAGFAIGAHLAFVIGFDFPLGRGFAGLVQTHGHVQLVGWAGLFIIGISLHIIPRLASVPIGNPRWIHAVLWLMAAGLLLRALAHPIVAYRGESAIGYWAVAGSGLLEWGGVGIYVALLLQTLQGVRGATRQPAFLSVRPFFATMLAGWGLYTSINLLLLFGMARRGDTVMDPAWNQFAIEVFTGLVLLPVAFAFSVRMLPLYLRLRAPDWPVRGTAYAYLVCLGVQMIPAMPLVSGPDPELAHTVSSLGSVLKGGVILWFVWQLDILTRCRDAWTVNREVSPLPDKRPTRWGLPDYGEFGRFERLVYAAYAWLVLAALSEMLVGGVNLLGRPMPIATDAVRHMVLLGFITHLIFGVSVRVIPGLLKKRCVASVRLVDATFWLGSIAAACRILPVLAPASVIDAIPGGTRVAAAAFGVSGMIGLAAVTCLAINVWKTAATA
jgi:uncharacterized protein involved in response to NO